MGEKQQTPETRVARIDAALELFDAVDGDAGSLILAARLCEEIAADAAGHVRDLAVVRPGSAGLGVWMALVSRVHLASAALFRRGAPVARLQARLERTSVVFSATPMKALRTRATRE